jgi:peptide/nickel transport system substrate-binding protein
MKTITRTPFRLVVLLVLLAALTITPLTAGAQAPGVDENTLVLGRLGGEPTSLDPSQVGAFNEFLHMFGTLYELGQASGSIEPHLANDYTISEDGKEWTFTLNEGLTCHDGEALTAEDVAYTIERMMNPDNGFTGNTAGFVVPSLGLLGARADDDLHVTFMFEGPQNRPLRLGLISEIFIHCKDSYENRTLEEAARNPIGSGPYAFVEWVQGDHITMRRVENYPLRDTSFETIVWRYFPEASTATAEMITGNVDIIKAFPADQLEPLQNSGVVQIFSYPSTARTYVGFNMNPGLEFSETVGGQAILKTEVRVALQHAVDVNAICTQLLKADCVRMNGPVAMPNHHPDLEPYPYDPALAEEMLDAAGYPRDANGVRFELVLNAINRPGAVGGDVAQVVAQYLSDVGVQTTVNLMEQATFVEQLIDHTLGPLFLISTGGSTWSTQYDLADFPQQDGETNYTGWANDEFFEIEASLPTLINDPEAERAAELRMLELFYNDPPWLFLYQAPVLEAVSNRLAYEHRFDQFLVVYDAKLK